MTIDAMGCQRAITEPIVSDGANYVLAVNNRPCTTTSWADSSTPVARADRSTIRHPTSTSSPRSTQDTARSRSGRLVRDLTWVERPDDWKGLAALAEIRADKASGKTSTGLLRHYIVRSATATAANILHAVRSHWGIENRLHRVLDMTLGGDFSRIRAGHAAKNLAVLGHAALNILRAASDPRSRRSKKWRIAGRRLRR